MFLHKGHIVHKYLGQHFLIDNNAINQIIQNFEPCINDIIFEIGPGLGALTKPLISSQNFDKNHPIHVIEIDTNLVNYLKQSFSNKIVIHVGNVLKFKFDKFIKNNVKSGLRIIGNLPYNISSPLLFYLIEFADHIVDQHFMLQREIVKRMLAQPGTKDYGRFSIMLQFYYSISKIFDLPPSSFKPSPKVYSSFICMKPKKHLKLLDIDMNLFTKIIKTAFSQKRKILRNTLRSYANYIDFQAINFNLYRRAEEVSIEEYIYLTKKISNILHFSRS